MADTADFEKLIEETLAKYPTKVSALLPILYILQQKHGAITETAIEEAARITETSPAYVYGVYSFYTFYKSPDEGKYRIWVCSTLTCGICGGRQLYNQIKEYLNGGATTGDKLFTLKKAECLGACEQSPVVMFEDEYIANATIEKIREKVESIRRNEDKL